MSSRPQTFSACGLRNCGRDDMSRPHAKGNSMNEANIEYRVRGLINTELQLNQLRKQSAVASQLNSTKNFEERAGLMLHLSYVNLAAP